MNLRKLTLGLFLAGCSYSNRFEQTSLGECEQVCDFNYSKGESKVLQGVVCYNELFELSEEKSSYVFHIDTTSRKDMHTSECITSGNGIYRIVSYNEEFSAASIYALDEIIEFGTPVAVGPINFKQDQYEYIVNPQNIAPTDVRPRKLEAIIKN